MMLFPAIDLKGGECVRLLRGDINSATAFNSDPAAQARLFEAQGFSWLHVVDLDGAFAGHAMNGASVSAILAAVKIPLQLGGGIRDMAAIEGWLGRGVRRVILGTVAVRDPDLVRLACRAFPGRIVVGIDARAGQVAVEGWAQSTGLKALDLARRFEDAGVAAIIYTDIERDGAMQGLNLAATVALANRVSVPVIASGGVSSVADLAALKAANCPGIEGVIAGRALYDGRLDPASALRALAC